MKKYTTQILYYLFIMLTCVTLSNAQEVTNKQTVAPLTTKEQASLLSLLSTIAQRYDCYFTIEESWQDTEPENILETSITSIQLSQIDNLPNVEQALILIPNITYKVNLSNPQVIHIIDSRLMDQKTYALEKLVETIEFTGYLNALPSVIQMKDINVSGPRMISLSDMRCLDLKTKINVKAQNMTVRELLSTAIKLHKNKRIMWITRTKVGNNETSHIYFEK
jgi:hypothetical protein